MTQTAEGCGWLAMYVARTGTGYTIEFLNIDHGFGALTAATTFDSDDAPLLMGQSWVQPPNLEGKLLRFLRTTADLSWLPDFEDVPNDEHGAPIVWCHATVCSGCGARSKVEASKILTRTTCAKCKSVIEIFQESISWIGPDSLHLISLWKALPAPNAEMLELGGGFTASQIVPNGTSIAGHLDNKVALLNTAEGLTVHLHHHNEGGKLSFCSMAPTLA